jgi:hypothetical protein
MLKIAFTDLPAMPLAWIAGNLEGGLRAGSSATVA